MQKVRNFDLWPTLIVFHFDRFSCCDGELTGSFIAKSFRPQEIKNFLTLCVKSWSLKLAISDNYDNYDDDDDDDDHDDDKALNNTFLTSLYQRAGANSPPKNCNKKLNFTSFVHDFNIFAHFVAKN